MDTFFDKAQQVLYGGIYGILDFILRDIILRAIARIIQEVKDNPLAALSFLVFAILYIRYLVALNKSHRKGKIRFQPEWHWNDVKKEWVNKDGEVIPGNPDEEIY